MQPFFKKKIEIKLPKSSSIHKIFPPYDLTSNYVYPLIFTPTNYSLALYYLRSPDNSYIWRTKVDIFSNDQEENCIMVGEGCFVIISPKKNVITAIDLLKESELIFLYEFTPHLQSMIKLFAFKESGLFCIVEPTKSCFSFKFTYFVSKSMQMITSKI